MQQCQVTTTLPNFHNVCTLDNNTAPKADKIFAKTGLFNSWNLYVSFLSVLLNLLGNPLIILVTCKTREMHNFTHYLFVNLAASDVALGVSSIISFTIRETLKEDSATFSLDWICKLVHTCPVPALSMVVSSLTLTVITWERFYNIARPFRARVARRNTKLIIGVIWSTAAIILVPVIIYTKFDPERHACEIAVPHLALYVIIITSIAFVIPLALMFYCYYKTVVVLWFSDTDRRLSNTPANQTALKKHRKKITKFLGIVIVSFLVCSVPVAVVLIARRFMTVPKTLFFSTILLAMFSSSVNPVIFMAQNGQFQNGLKNLVWRRNSAVIPNPRNLAHSRESQSTTTI